MSRLHLLLILIFTVVAIPATAQSLHKLRLQLPDKQGTPHNLEDPSTYLSARAIERRQKMNIAIDSTDLPVSPLYIGQLTAVGAEIHNTSKWFNSVVVEADSSTIANLSALDFITNIDTVFIPGSGKRGRSRMNDIELSDEDSRNNEVYLFSPSVYGESFNQIGQHHGDKLHSAGFRGEGMIIAVMDAGFFRVDAMDAFKHLFEENRILATWDFVDREATVYEDNSHGTYVLSVIAANIPGELIGTAPAASFILLRSEDAASEFPVEEDNWVAAAEFADSLGADVFNTPLGYSTFSDSSMNYAYTDMNGRTARISLGSNMAARKGIAVVSSAGNEGNGPWRYISAPADADSILSIGAINDEGNRASFSSVGPTADGRVKPDVVARGAGTIVANIPSGVRGSNGTSFSAPVIAGLTAVLWQAHPEWTNIELIEAIRKSGHQASAPDSLLGYGIPDFFRAWYEPVFPEIEYLQEDQPMVYPNPSRQEMFVMIYSKDDRNYNFQLTDLAGKVIHRSNHKLKKESYNKIKIPAFQQLSAGSYVLNIRNNKENHAYKIMKQ